MWAEKGTDSSGSELRKPFCVNSSRNAVVPAAGDTACNLRLTPTWIGPTSERPAEGQLVHAYAAFSQIIMEVQAETSSHAGQASPSLLPASARSGRGPPRRAR